MSEAVDRDDLNPKPVVDPSTNGGRSRSVSWQSIGVRRLVIVVLAGVVLVLASRFSLQDFHVTGRSMTPAVAPNEVILVDKLSYDFVSPQRGDIVILRVPIQPRTLYIKRIVAVPGDRIQVHNSAVWLNGKALHQSYASSSPDYSMDVIPGTQSDVVPPGNYFVLGDNRAHSNDSHRWGLVPRSDIIGRAVLIFWPLNHFGFLSEP